MTPDELQTARDNCRALALSRAARGFAVFPLAPQSKVPLAGGGVTTATTDAAVIEAWDWSSITGYGMTTAGLTVIDIDPRNGGDVIAGMLGLVAHDTMRTRTGGGGTHAIHIGETRSTAGVVGAAVFGVPLGTSGVDTKSGPTSYIVGPGSLVNGNLYTLECDAAPTMIPGEIAAMIGARERQSRKSLVDVPHDDANMIARFAASLGTAGIVYQGARDEAVYKAACRAHDWAVTPATATDLITAHMTLIPAFSRDQIARVVSHVADHAQNEFGCAHPAQDLTPIADQIPRDVAAEAAAAKAAQAAATLFAPLADIWCEDYAKPLPWLIEGLLLPGAVTGMIAPGGVGKSAWHTGAAAALACGDGAFFGVADFEPMATLTVNLEDSGHIASQRAMAALEFAAGAKAGAAGRMHQMPAPDPSALKLVVRDQQTRKLVPSDKVAALGAYVQKHSIRAVFLDPFAQLHDGNETDNSDVSAVMAVLSSIAARLNVAVVVVHHTRKSTEAGSSGGMDAARGAGAFGTSCRVVVMLHAATHKDCNTLGVPVSECRKYVRLEGAKANYSAARNEPLWFEKQQHTFGAGGTTVVMRPYKKPPPSESDTLANFIVPHIDPAKGTASLNKAATLIAATGIQYVRDGEGPLSVATWANRLKERFRAAVTTPAGRVALVQDGEHWRFTLETVQPFEGNNDA